MEIFEGIFVPYIVRLLRQEDAWFIFASHTTSTKILGSTWMSWLFFHFLLSLISQLYFFNIILIFAVNWTYMTLIQIARKKPHCILLKIDEQNIHFKHVQNVQLDRKNIRFWLAVFYIPFALKVKLVKWIWKCHKLDVCYYCLNDSTCSAFQFYTWVMMKFFEFFWRLVIRRHIICYQNPKRSW